MIWKQQKQKMDTETQKDLHVSYCAWCILVLCSFLVAIHCYMLGRVETEFLSHATLD